MFLPLLEPTLQLVSDSSIVLYSSSYINLSKMFRSTGVLNIPLYESKDCLEPLFLYRFVTLQVPIRLGKICSVFILFMSLVMAKMRSSPAASSKNNSFGISKGSLDFPFFNCFSTHVTSITDHGGNWFFLSFLVLPYKVFHKLS